VIQLKDQLQLQSMASSNLRAVSPGLWISAPSDPDCLKVTTPSQERYLLRLHLESLQSDAKAIPPDSSVVDLCRGLCRKMERMAGSSDWELRVFFVH
jgi:hypothetical protein